VSGGNLPWPDLPLAAWSDTCDTLQLWTQIAGKVRIALTPLVNHWWNATFYVTARGLAAPAMSFAGGMVDITFDFAGHRLAIETSDGGTEAFALKPMPVCDFYSEFMARLHRLGVDVQIRTIPCEILDAVPFDKDRTHAQYDPVYAQRFWHVLVQVNRVMNVFRARFLGKASPVHFFWGSFDLAVTRFSGRTAPPPKGHTPYVADRIMAEAYSHECSSCGFWPGNGGFGNPAFYVYAYPEPAGYGDTRLATAGASYNKDLGQFILPYDAVRQARNPDALLLGFLQETYDGAANLAKWDRTALERSNQGTVTHR
jgi:Family of unknown function (DUF5996)